MYSREREINLMIKAFESYFVSAKQYHEEHPDGGPLTSMYSGETYKKQERLLAGWEEARDQWNSRNQDGK